MTGRALLILSVLLASSCSDDGTLPSAEPDQVASVSLSVEGASLLVGRTLQLSAVARDAKGVELSGFQMQWTSTNPAIASVTSSGLVTAQAVGTVDIQAQTQGFTGTARIDTYETPGTAGIVQVDATQRFQTMRGWQAGTEWGIDHPLSSTVRDQVLDKAANELGIDRVRLTLRSGSENTRDWYGEYVAGTVTYDQYRCNRYATVNDNGDPSSLNASGFHYTHLDSHVENTVLPLRQRLQARGEQLYVVLAYLAHTVQNCAGTQFHHVNGEEYAEFLVAAFLHLRDTYGVVPDAVELANEPDLSWTYGSQPLSGMLAAAGRRLRAAGFTPAFMAPSTTSAANAVAYYNDLIAADGNADLVSELSYHRYAGGLSDLQAIRSRATTQHIATVMGEKNGAGIQQLHEDLTIANASAWEQGGLGWYKTEGWVDVGGAHYATDYAIPGTPTVELGVRSRPLRQYFRYVRRGAVRIGATSQDAGYRPTAFINRDGQYVAVVWTTKAGSFTISGLRSGTYGVNYTTDVELSSEAPTITIVAGQPVSVSIPRAGALTVYGK